LDFNSGGGAASEPSPTTLPPPARMRGNREKGEKDKRRERKLKWKWGKSSLQPIYRRSPFVCAWVHHLSCTLASPSFLITVKGPLMPWSLIRYKLSDLSNGCNQFNFNPTRPISTNRPICSLEPNRSLTQAHLRLSVSFNPNSSCFSYYTSHNTACTPSLDVLFISITLALHI